MRENAHISPISELELTMRDVMEGMADFALDFAFDVEAAQVELIVIEPAPTAAQVIPFSRRVA